MSDLPHIFAIDPGTTESQYVLWDPVLEKVNGFGFLPNTEMLREASVFCRGNTASVIEGIASYGMPVGAETFQTCIWIGRFWEAIRAGSKGDPTIVFRIDVKSHLCHSGKAKDGNVRQALIDRFGPVGTKANKGRLYGISGHAWAALALAVTFGDKLALKAKESA